MAHRLVLPAGAVRMLRGLLAELIALHDGAPTAADGSTHPAWRRLYPSTTADPRLDRDLRDLVHPDLVEGRREAFALVADVLAERFEQPDDLPDDDPGAAVADEVRVGLGAPVEVLRLDDDQAMAVLGVVNDIRLALAATVDMPSLLDDDDRLRDDVDDDARGTVELVEWLAVVQEQVLATLAPLSQAHFDDPVHDRADGSSDDRASTDLDDSPSSESRDHSEDHADETD